MGHKENTATRRPVYLAYKTHNLIFHSKFTLQSDQKSPSFSQPIKCRPDSLKTITQLPSTRQQLTRMSLLPFVISSFLLATVTCLSVEKAASPYTNIGCQCSSLTFVDSSGLIQGNCKR